MKRGMIPFMLVRGFLFTGLVMALWLPTSEYLFGDPVRFDSRYVVRVFAWGLIGVFMAAIEYSYYHFKNKNVK